MPSGKVFPRFFFVPVTSTNLVDGNTVRMALIIGILALLIIFVSSMNYVLISVSMLVRRSKTIGTLKCNGAGKGDILAISLYETALLVSAALLLATVLIYAMRAQVETLTGIRFQCCSPRHASGPRCRSSCWYSCSRA